MAQKVIIISNSDAINFEADVNAFIKDRKIIDIKYQTLAVPVKYNNNMPSQINIIDRALIFYED